MSLGTLGSYRLIERIGEGGMGVVFRAHDSRLDRQVAVKVISERHALDRDYRTRLMREARAEARLNHPNIAMCFDVGEAVPDPANLFSPGSAGAPSAPVLYLAMELVPGTDLDELIGSRPVALPRVLDLSVQIASGLEAAHAAGLVHRDLKPGNVRVTPEGRAKILDFGLARQDASAVVDSEASTQPSHSLSDGAIVGTVLYMSPEQAAGQTVDARSDLFSFGVVVYELVTGRRPFGGDDLVAASYSLANDVPAPLARYAGGVPDELERIVGKLLEKRPADRYQSAHEVVTDLQRLQGKISSSPSGVKPPKRSPALRRAWLPVAGVVAAAAIAWWMGGGPGHGSPSGSASLAVLGFENATGDSSLSYLCSGLAADVEGDLVQGARLNVSSVAEVTSLPGDQRAPRNAARRLGVRSVLTGIVRRQGVTNRLRVELVDGRTGFVRWSAGYDLAPEHAYLVKQQIATAVATALGARRAASHARGRGAPSAVAYEEYLRGRQALARNEYLRGIQAIKDLDDPLASSRAAAALDSTVELSPDFALAWAVRSRVLAWRYTDERDSVWIAAAERSADRALELDSTLLEARVARARVYRLRGRLPQAVADLDAVLRVNPAWDEAWRELCYACQDSGNFVRAEASMRQAVALQPGYASNWRALGNVLLKTGKAGRYDEARKAFLRVIDLEPGQNSGYEGLGNVEVYEGHFPAAASWFRKLPQKVKTYGLASNMATAFFFSGQPDDALPYYRMAVDLRPRIAVNRANLGDCFRRMGRADSARAHYRMAAQLDEADLRVSPDNADLLAQFVMYLAKAGECDRSWAEQKEHHALLARYDDNSEIQHSLAKAFALCGHRAEAMAALRKMAAKGAATDLLKSEDELASLRGDPAFQALLRAGKR